MCNSMNKSGELGSKRQFIQSLGISGGHVVAFGGLRGTRGKPRIQGEHWEEGQATEQQP